MPAKVPEATNKEKLYILKNRIHAMHYYLMGVSVRNCQSEKDVNEKPTIFT